LAFLIVVGGLAFNIGNVAGAGLDKRDEYPCNTNAHIVAVKSSSNFDMKNPAKYRMRNSLMSTQ
jgi:hypothetical protein